jgi:hypothetical protein
MDAIKIGVNHPTFSKGFRQQANIKDAMKKLLKGEKLKQYADDLGIECSGIEIPYSKSGEHVAVYEYELQRKVMEVERSQREHRLWLVAFISAIASAASALVALFASIRS